VGRQVPTVQPAASPVLENVGGGDDRRTTSLPLRLYKYYFCKAFDGKCLVVGDSTSSLSPPRLMPSARTMHS
jgi:hypothetical protein